MRGLQRRLLQKPTSLTILGRRHSAPNHRMLPIAPPPEPLPQIRAVAPRKGHTVAIDGERVKSTWEWRGNSSTQPDQLWLPLDLLEARLGFRRQARERGDALEWFGRTVVLSRLDTRALGDEVGFDVGNWLTSVGVRTKRKGETLILSLPSPAVQGLRRGKGDTANRLVLDLDGPTFAQRIGTDLAFALQATPRQHNILKQLGLDPVQNGQLLRLRGQAIRLRSLSLAKPWRLVLDGVGGRNGAVRWRGELPLNNAALGPYMQKGLVMEERTINIGVKPLRIFRIGGRLNSLGLRLQPLAQQDRQQGLNFLPELSRSAQALVAINGGFFNRINQLPLGALRRDGTWLSGPILNRGVIAWNRDSTLHFGRLQLQQELQVNSSKRWRLDFLNSGYVQKGLSRYTPNWGPRYRALSGNEEALLIRRGRVEKAWGQASLRRGVPIPTGTDLIVARGGAGLPAGRGDRVKLFLWSRSALGRHANVLGGGPLLMQQGRIVLNGRSEGFSPSFLHLTAPRTVVGQGRDGQWMLTVHGAASSDPTLLETALAAQQLGFTEALNLDGGSSTTLVVSDQTVMNGRGSTPRVHNGLGLIRS